MKINKLFDLLDDWRYLPAYQLERRADIFFALHLEIILEKVLGVEIDKIIPEFPLRLGELPDENPNSNLSYKIDYLAYSKEQNKVYLIELKTENSSLRNAQDKYLKSAQKIKVQGILEGLQKIYKASNQKVKYDYLLNMLNQQQKINWIRKNDKSFEILDIDIEPTIIYIQPTSKENNEAIITFDKIIKVLSEIKEPLTQRFIESLEKWKIDTNNKK